MGKRREVITTYECKAPKELFGPWDEVPQELKDKIPTRGLGCDGGGTPGTWCQGTITSCLWATPPMEEEDVEIFE